MEEKKKKEEFLPILGSLVKPLLISAAGAVVGDILKGIISKIFGRGKRRSRRMK